MLAEKFPPPVLTGANRPYVQHRSQYLPTYIANIHLIIVFMSASLALTAG